VFGPSEPGQNHRMERGSDKQGPRMDDELKKESQPFERGAPVESRVEEHRLVEEASPDGDEEAQEASPPDRDATPPDEPPEDRPG
jgi:hypothetical protein